ncbi:hypothetical protein HZS80_20965 [Halomonas glaciei]|uniref:Uncharacterized protein n=1 Tax=Vreelandella glaciei TaxID=186761 RepID=A0A7Z0LXB2_9GAMM|nr:hypothetical protein [Halomonas glaciei]NYS80140.1 hypothetical protein [Halomonas glaciei]
MSKKLNVLNIIKEHMGTLKNNATGKASLIDAFVFMLVPFGLAVAAAYFVPVLKNDQLSLAVNFGAIITALLMSVLVLVYDQESKLKSTLDSLPDNADYSKKKSFYLKIRLMQELYQNICFSIVSALLLVVFSFAQIFIKDIVSDCLGQWFLMFLTACIVFFFMNIVLTMLMVIKRFHALLTN